MWTVKGATTARKAQTMATVKSFRFICFQTRHKEVNSVCSAAEGWVKGATTATTSQTPPCRDVNYRMKPYGHQHRKVFCLLTTQRAVQASTYWQPEWDFRDSEVWAVCRPTNRGLTLHVSGQETLIFSFWCFTFIYMSKLQLRSRISYLHNQLTLFSSKEKLHVIVKQLQTQSRSYDGENLVLLTGFFVTHICLCNRTGW